MSKTKPMMSFSMDSWEMTRRGLESKNLDHLGPAVKDGIKGFGMAMYWRKYAVFKAEAVKYVQWFKVRPLILSGEG